MDKLTFKGLCDECEDDEVELWVIGDLTSIWLCKKCIEKLYELATK